MSAFGAGLICLTLSSRVIADDAGKKIYDAKCAACHGKDAKGNAAMAKMFKVDASKLNLTSEEFAKKSDEEILKIISDGKGKMPAYSKQIKAEERKAVLSYLRGLAPASQAEKKETSIESPAKAADTLPAAVVSEEAKKEYSAKCVFCHAKDGEGNVPMANVFKVKAEALNLIDDATLAKSDDELAKITADGLNKMPAYKGKISEAMVRDIVVYIRFLKTSK